VSSQNVRGQLFTAPAAADPVELTPNASAWGNSAWVELLASASTDLVATGIIVLPGNDNVAKDFEIDIGTGAMSSEVVVTTFRGSYGDPEHANPGYMPLPIALDNILSGERVAARMRKSNTGATPTWFVAMTYYKKPLVGEFLTSAKPQKCVPSAATSTSLTTGASAWANSTWTQMVASTSASLVLTGIAVKLLSLDMSWEVDIGIGAAAAETVLTTIRFHHTGISTVDGPSYFPLYHPLDNIPVSSRIAARTRSESSSGSRTLTCALTYLEKPL
jgi:hypothetical protein